MTIKPLVVREVAVRDVDEAIDHYVSEGGERLALGFIADLERTYRHIARHPHSSSPRHAVELSLPGLRSWRLRRFPYMVFYVDLAEQVDIWRVLHGERNIPQWLRDP